MSANYGLGKRTMFCCGQFACHPEPVKRGAALFVHLRSVGDGRTAIRDSANVYYTGIDSSYPARVNPYSPISTSISCWTDSNGDWIPQQSELGFNFATKTINPGRGSGSTFGNNNLYDPNLQRPLSLEFSHRRATRVSGQFRSHRNLLPSRLLAADCKR
jgi:hypothetical protein